MNILLRALPEYNIGRVHAEHEWDRLTDVPLDRRAKKIYADTVNTTLTACSDAFVLGVQDWLVEKVGHNHIS